MSEAEKAGLPVLGFASATAFAAWLRRQPADCKGLWLKLAKKDTAAPSVSRQEAIEVALCHGWIDGQLDKYDAGWWLVRFTPRSARSRWSERNCRMALQLADAGRMQPVGLAQVEAARADGRWERAYAPQSTAVVPLDLTAAIEASPAAKRFFGGLNGVNRFALIYRVNDAKTAKTRAQRIAKFVAMLERGETLHPPRTGAA
jgi:uncharacterized protein YdeI (YjbR/CyaY-like superfamily)